MQPIVAGYAALISASVTVDSVRTVSVAWATSCEMAPGISASVSFLRRFYLVLFYLVDSICH